jgi:hypothetical protein
MHVQHLDATALSWLVRTGAGALFYVDALGSVHHMAWPPAAPLARVDALSAVTAALSSMLSSGRSSNEQDLVRTCRLGHQTKATALLNPGGTLRDAHVI